jgi:hypothetical protein
LKLAQIPTVIVESFKNPLDICEGWGMNLVSTLQDPQKRQAMVLKAREIIADPKHHPANEVYRQLICAAAPGRKAKVFAHDDVVRADDGAMLFRVRQQRNAIAVLLPLDKVGARTLKEIYAAVSRILQLATPQAIDSSCD